MPSYLREASRNPFVLKISLLAALGGLLFGYDTGVISGALLYIKKDLHAGDLAQSSGQLVAARMVLGLAVGAASAVVPLYIAEHTPPKIRGGTVSYNQLMVTVGILVAYLVDFALRDVGSNWRWMLGLGALPGVFLVIGMLFVPYSPRWLMQKGRRDEAREVLRRTRAGEDYEKELTEIESVLSEERRSGIRTLLRPSLRPMLVIGIGLAVIQQVVGVNTVVYFSPTILTYTGLHASDAIAQALSVGITNVVFTIIAVLLLDRVGRRALLIAGTIGLTVALLMLSAFFAFDWKDEAPWVALLALVLFIASFAVGLGPGFWLMISEIFPLGVRGSAMAVCSVFNWAANFFVSYYFLQLIGAIGKAWTFGLYAVMGVLGIVFFLTKVPETKNRTLEEIEHELGAPSTRPSGPATRHRTA